jgi:hypothetical protein
MSAMITYYGIYSSLYQKTYYWYSLQNDTLDILFIGSFSPNSVIAQIANLGFIIIWYNFLFAYMKLQKL